MSPILAGIYEFLSEKGFEVSHYDDYYSPCPSAKESLSFQWKGSYVDLFQRVPDELVLQHCGMEHYIDLNHPDSLPQIIDWLDRLKVPVTLCTS